MYPLFLGKGSFCSRRTLERPMGKQNGGSRNKSGSPQQIVTSLSVSSGNHNEESPKQTVYANNGEILFYSNS